MATLRYPSFATFGRQIGCLFAIFFLFSGCMRQVIQTPSGVISDGRYDLAFPFGENSDALTDMLETVKLVNATAYYESYQFPIEDQIQKGDINKDLIESGKYERTVFNDYAVGTATVIYHHRNRVAALTCAHVVDFADTIYTFFANENGEESPFIHRVSFKKQQKNFLANLRQGEDFEILAIDHENDIAIVGKKLLFVSDDILVFDYRLGRSEELEWGSLLYLIGYPSGKKMLTTGIVSNPNRNFKHDFLVDALFNRGFSGGIALAIRDGYPNFELVGIVNAVSAENEVVLVPSEFPDKGDFPINVPYTGSVYAAMRKKINYGISFGISIESILLFLQENDSQLRRKGYLLDLFFKNPMEN